MLHSCIYDMLHSCIHIYIHIHISLCFQASIGCCVHACIGWCIHSYMYNIHIYTYIYVYEYCMQGQMTLTCFSEHVAPSSWKRESTVFGLLLVCACAACAGCQTIGLHSAPCVPACYVKPSMECASARMSSLDRSSVLPKGLIPTWHSFPAR